MVSHSQDQISVDMQVMQPKLFARWMGFGSLFPFCRGHSESDTTDHEPWSFGEEVRVLDLPEIVNS